MSTRSGDETSAADLIICDFTLWIPIKLLWTL